MVSNDHPEGDIPPFLPDNLSKDTFRLYEEGTWLYLIYFLYSRYKEIVAA